MPQSDFDERLYRNYKAGRCLDEAAERVWMEAVRRHVGNANVETILDVGCGTGIFSFCLAAEFRAKLIGVEPSDKMRAVAEAEDRPGNVEFRAGSAEKLPLSRGECDLAWMSQVVHHLRSLNEPARELHRVLKPGGLLFIRGNFQDRLAGCPYYEFFPSALPLDNDRHPTVESVRRGFEQNGFQFLTLETIGQQAAQNLREYVERIRHRAYSSFQLISDEEFDKGLRQMERAAALPEANRPVIELIDLLVFRRAADL